MIVINCDVVFNKDQFWNWDAGKVKQQLQIDFDGDNDFGEGRQQPIMQIQSEQQRMSSTKEDTCMNGEFYGKGN